MISQTRPDIVHFHNTFPLISPSAYYAAKANGAAVVQTLHNYRLACPNALFYRKEGPCESCLGKTIPWPGIVHACYRDSYFASAAVAAMLSFHRLLKTWQKKVDAFIVQSEFAKQKFIQAGIFPESLFIKPNFLSVPNSSSYTPHSFALFVGRLSPEKGIHVLLRAWTHIIENIPLQIIGEGPLESLVQKSEKADPRIKWHGKKSKEEVIELMSKASFLIFPSTCYESSPMVIIEAFSQRLPVLTSNIGVMGEMIDNGQNGVHFDAGDAADLAKKALWLWNHSKNAENVGKAGLQRFDTLYNVLQHYKSLMDIYKIAMIRSKK